MRTARLPFYALVIWTIIDAILSIRPQRRALPRWARLAATLPVIYIASIPFIFALMQLRANSPNAFPPTSMIP